MTPHKNHLKILRQAYVQIQTNSCLLLSDLAKGLRTLNTLSQEPDQTENRVSIYGVVGSRWFNISNNRYRL